MQEREGGLPFSTSLLSFYFVRSIFFLDSMSSVVRWAMGVNERTWLGSGGIVAVYIFSILVSYDFLTLDVDFFFYGFAFNAFFAATATAYNFKDFAELSLGMFNCSLDDSRIARLF